MSAPSEGELPVPPERGAPRRDSDESKITGDPSRRESASSADMRALIVRQEKTIADMVTESLARRLSFERREADLARQRDEAARREADLVRQRDEAARRADEAARRADEERAERLRAQELWRCAIF